MNRLKNSVPVIAAAFLSLAIVSWATPAAAAGADVDVAYQYLHVSAGGSGESVPAGFAAGINLPLNAPWSVVGDFGWNRKSENGGHFTATSFGAGLRYTSATMAQFKPYAQAVVGVENDKDSFSSGSVSVSNSQSNFMLQPGVGGMFDVSSLKAFAEVDYRWVHTSGDSANDLVVRVGIIIPVGKK